MDYTEKTMSEMLVEEYKNPEEIVNLSANKSIIVQSNFDDENELILERLSHLKQNDRNMRMSGVKIITPDIQYKNNIESRVDQFNISDIEVHSVEEYYCLLLKRFSSEITSKTYVLDEINLPLSILKELYSENYSKNTEIHYNDYWKTVIEELKENNIDEICSKTKNELPNFDIYNHTTYLSLLKTFELISQNDEKSKIKYELIKDEYKEIVEIKTREDLKLSQYIDILKEIRQNVIDVAKKQINIIDEQESFNNRLICDLQKELDEGHQKVVHIKNRVRKIQDAIHDASIHYNEYCAFETVEKKDNELAKKIIEKNKANIDWITDVNEKLKSTTALNFLRRNSLKNDLNNAIRAFYVQASSIVKEYISIGEKKAAELEAQLSDLNKNNNLLENKLAEEKNSLPNTDLYIKQYIKVVDAFEKEDYPDFETPKFADVLQELRPFLEKYINNYNEYKTQKDKIENLNAKIKEKNLSKLNYEENLLSYSLQENLSECKTIAEKLSYNSILKNVIARDLLDVFKANNTIYGTGEKGNYRFKLYLKLLLCNLYYDRSAIRDCFINIYEAQNLSLVEYKLIKKISSDTCVFNLYGDITKEAPEYKSITDWSAVASIIECDNVYHLENKKHETECVETPVVKEDNVEKTFVADNEPSGISFDEWCHRRNTTSHNTSISSVSESNETLTIRQDFIKDTDCTYEENNCSLVDEQSIAAPFSNYKKTKISFDEWCTLNNKNIGLIINEINDNETKTTDEIVDNSQSIFENIEHDSTFISEQNISELLSEINDSEAKTTDEITDDSVTIFENIEHDSAFISGQNISELLSEINDNETKTTDEIVDNSQSIFENIEHDSTFISEQNISELLSEINDSEAKTTDEITDDSVTIFENIEHDSAFISGQNISELLSEINDNETKIIDEITDDSVTISENIEFDSPFISKQNISELLEEINDDIKITYEEEIYPSNDKVVDIDSIFVNELSNHEILNNNEALAFSDEQTYEMRYGLAADNFKEVKIENFNFSVRIYNRLKGKNVNFISDLLKLTPNELKKINGFGKGCLEELDSVLSNLSANAVDLLTDYKNKSDNTFSALVTKNRYDLNSKNNQDPFISSFIKNNIDNVIDNNFDFIYEEETKNVKNHLIPFEADIKKYKDAREILNPELIRDSVYNTEKVMPILKALHSFYSNNKRYVELCLLLDKIPSYRRKNKAIGYIKAFTITEGKRKLLIDLCTSEETTIEQMVYESSLDKNEIYLVFKDFLNWCKFDLHSELNELIKKIYANERISFVLESRAKGMTLEEIGTPLGVTRERIRQIEAKARRKFEYSNRQLRILLKISAERNGDTILTHYEIEEYCKENAEVLIFLLRISTSVNYTYDKYLNVFIIGDDSLQDRLLCYMENLPEHIEEKDIPEILSDAENEGIPTEMLEISIKESYNKTGEVYHRRNLTLCMIYATVINEHYPNGIRAHDPEELKKFREHVKNKYGNIKLPDNDRPITAIISRECILCGKGVYKPRQKQYIPKELAKKIHDYIASDEKSIVVIKSLLNVFRSELAPYGVDNKYYLHGILRELFEDEFVFARDYVTKKGNSLSLSNEIINYIKKSQYPVNKLQIQQAFPGVSDMTISIVSSDSDVLNYFGEYFHINNLQITDAEQDYLNKILKEAVSDNAAHHSKDIYAVINSEHPEIFSRNAAMNQFAAFSILEYLFGDTYQFSRPYIANLGVEIGRPADQLHELIYSSDEYEISEIREFAKENHLQIPSMIDYINTCNDEFLMLNSDRIARISELQITKEMAIKIEDLILNEISETVPIRDLTIMWNLPPISTAWTDWLIYSVMNKWAKKLTVATTSNQLKQAVPLISPLGKMEIDKFGNLGANDSRVTVQVDNLDNIDDLIEDVIDDEIMEDFV